MRTCGRIVTLLCVSVALLSTGVAYADISPIAKPSDETVAPLPRPHVKSVVQPTPAPRVTPAAKPATTQVTPAAQTTPVQTTPVPTTPVRTTPVRTTPARTTPARVTPQHTVSPVHVTIPARIKVASINGGRELAVVRVLEDKVVHSKVARLLPTPLALVGLHEALPSSEAWPDWLLAAIAIMASAEAFLLTRLAGARHFVEPSEQ
jgi:hypothetical protein